MNALSDIENVGMFTLYGNGHIEDPKDDSIYANFLKINGKPYVLIQGTDALESILFGSFDKHKQHDLYSFMKGLKW